MLGCGCNPRSGHMQESNSACITERNNKSLSLSLSQINTKNFKNVIGEIVIPKGHSLILLFIIFWYYNFM